MLELLDNIMSCFNQFIEISDFTSFKRNINFQFSIFQFFNFSIFQFFSDELNGRVWFNCFVDFNRVPPHHNTTPHNTTQHNTLTQHTSLFMLGTEGTFPSMKMLNVLVCYAEIQQVRLDKYKHHPWPLSQH